MKWVNMGKTINEEGTTITYEAADYPITIESRKRHIPHAGCRSGTWDHTSYFVLYLGEEVVEKNSLRDAKEYAEKMLNKEEK